METRIREMLINWAKFKDQVPVDNSAKDPLYSVKLELLVYGYESLGNSTYQEWSKGLVSRIGAREDYSDHYSNSVECLTWSVETLVLEHLCIDTSDVKTGHLTALKAVWHAIQSLTPFSSNDLLEVLEGSSTNDNKPSHQQIRESAELIEKRYFLAMKGSIEGDIAPLLDLCSETFNTLLHAKQVAAVMPKAKQQSNAGKIKNEPYRVTEKYAISLYQEKEWKTKQSGVDKIQYKVMEYGRESGVHWTSDRQANKTIYKWIAGHIKENE
jgi:hypothetical protein